MSVRLHALNRLPVTVVKLLGSEGREHIGDTLT